MLAGERLTPLIRGALGSLTGDVTYSDVMCCYCSLRSLSWGSIWGISGWPYRGRVVRSSQGVGSLALSEGV